MKLKDLLSVLDAEDGIELYGDEGLIGNYERAEDIDQSYMGCTVIDIHVGCYEACIEILG